MHCLHYQSLPDACLDRMRASLSVLASLLAENGLSDESEIILVEYNPCHTNAAKEEGACDERPEGYMSLGRVVETLVEAPMGGKGPPIRVLKITEVRAMAQSANLIFASTLLAATAGCTPRIWPPF